MLRGPDMDRLKPEPKAPNGLRSSPCMEMLGGPGSRGAARAPRMSMVAALQIDEAWLFSEATEAG